MSDANDFVNMVPTHNKEDWAMKQSFRPIRRYIDNGEFKGADRFKPHPIHKFVEGLLLDVMFLCAGIGFGYVLWG